MGIEDGIQTQNRKKLLEFRRTRTPFCEETEICTQYKWWSGSVVKSPLANAGHMGLIPVLGRSPGEGDGNPLQYSCLGNPVDRGAWWTNVHGVSKVSDTTQQLNTTTVKCGVGLVARSTHMSGRKELKDGIKVRKFNSFCFSCTNGLLWCCWVLSLKCRHIPQFINTSEYRAPWSMRKEMKKELCSSLPSSQLTERLVPFFIHYMLCVYMNGCDTALTLFLQENASIFELDHLKMNS